MSDQDQKDKHSRRLMQLKTAIAKQINIAKAYSMHLNPWKYINEPHRNHKTHILNCGSPHCSMCGNPRKWFKQETVQERRQKQDLEQVRNRHNNGTPPNEHI